MTFSAKDYWELRYSVGGNSGSGSRGSLAQQKADHINTVLRRGDVSSVVDWGCGDGTLLSLLDLESVQYVGVDVTASGIRMCAKKRPEVSLILWRQSSSVLISTDLALSIDILFHFPDDDEYITYLGNLFGSARKLVLIHNVESGDPPGEHVRWRTTRQDIAELYPKWELLSSSLGVNGGEFDLYRRSR